MQFKKLVAGALGALMVGATAGLAATLDQYPAPFAANGAINSVIVVGAGAQTADVIGAANLGARLAGESYTLASAGTTSGTVSGGSVYSKDVPFGTAISSTNNFKTPLKSFDVTALKTGSVTMNSTTYNWEESVAVANTVRTMINTSAGSDKSLDKNPYLLYGANTVAYQWNFTQNFDVTNVNAANPLRITMLGKTFKITNITTNTFTASLADEQFLKVGQSYTVTDTNNVAHTITLVDVASDAVVVKVDNDQKTISTAGTTTSVGGINVKFVSSFYKSTDSNNSGATLQAGTDIAKTYTTNDPFPGESTTDANWQWDLSGLYASAASTTHSFKVYNVKASATTATGTPAPIGVGQSLAFPNNYLKLGLDSVTSHNEATYTLEYQSTADRSINGASPAAFKLSTTTADGITTAGGSKTKVVYLVHNNTVGGEGGSLVNVVYIDSNNKAVSTANYTSGNIVDLTFQDTTVDVFWTGANGTTPSQFQFRELVAPGTHIAVNATNSTTAFTGMNTVNSADATDVSINSTSNSAAQTGVGTRDENILTNGGIIINTPKSNANSDKLVLTVPSTQLKGFISLKAGSTTTANTSTSAGTVKVVSPVKSAIAKLDKDASADITAKNAILVGGPCANTLVQQLATAGKLKRASANNTDLTCTGWRAMGDNFGVIAVVDNAFQTGYSALVVAGTRAEDTNLGTQILQQYDNFAGKLKGSMVEYSGADVSTVTFK